MLTAWSWCWWPRQRDTAGTAGGRSPGVLCAAADAPGGLPPKGRGEKPTNVGERAWVLCRAGICAEDFENRTDELRAACYARDARVTRNRRWSHLITIDIIRRDTLAAGNTIASSLARLTDRSPRRPHLTLVPPPGGEQGPSIPA